ncbi:MAG: thiamine pyrophosphate-dependent enzyme [Candidatus Pacebacteria bacterium]|nr:thiamine pyrophosphate-dependent enzyme [Candidatus Paceibacterota bacterium]
MKKCINKEILLGNEAIVWGALESGVDFVSVYPGTPSSEIGDVFSEIAKDHGVYFEVSTNEKVALEAAIGASFSGLKSLVAMKNFGLNVASDSLMPFAYTGTKGPAVIVVADDPSCFSSAQSEENSRGFAYLSHIPILEPSDAQEAKDFTKLGFEISEKFSIPVILRITTRVAHQRMLVCRSEINNSKAKGRFEKDVRRFVTMPPRVLEMKKELFEKLDKIKPYIEKINKTEDIKSSKSLGIICSGICYLYVKEALDQMNLKLPVLKIGSFYPLAEKSIKDFIKNIDNVLIVEELEGYLEKEVMALAKDTNCKVRVFGKDVLLFIGELDSEKVVFALSKILKRKYKKPEVISFNLAKRFPRLCTGCPYWTIFSAVKKSSPDAVFGGDIGCYMLSGFPPHNMQDYLFSMGSSIGIAHGIKKSANQKLIAFIGDSTFFHSGIPALINAVFNKSNPLIIIMDNRITAMTGHQVNPGIGKTAMGEATSEIKIEEIVKACGVKNLKVVNFSNVKELESFVKEFLNKDEVSVIIARGTCAYILRKQKQS